MPEGGQDRPDFPKFLSPSQVSTLLSCGERYRLERVERVPSCPTWGGVGGSAVHQMTEDHDRAMVAGKSFDGAWSDYWQQALDQEAEDHPEFDPSEYYVSGRASKTWPNKENVDWWTANGPKFVGSWIRWIEGCGLEIWEYPDPESGELIPAIELRTYAENGDLHVKSYIDRILFDPVDGSLSIVDLKSGSFTPTWPQQMAFNNLCFKQHVGCPTEDGATHAGFWKARKGGVEEWTRLDRFPDTWLWDQVAKAKAIRDQHLFVAQPTNFCKAACGVRDYCVAVGGKHAPIFDRDATMTQGSEK